MSLDLRTVPRRGRRLPIARRAIWRTALRAEFQGAADRVQPAPIGSVALEPPG